jgi:hypothetical protein
MANYGWGGDLAPDWFPFITRLRSGCGPFLDRAANSLGVSPRTLVSGRWAL